MLISLVSSLQDPAGTAIRNHLLRELGTDGSKDYQYGSNILRFLETEGRLIYEDSLDERTKSDLIIFLSRHTSKNPFPALTVHVTGNFGEAALGGESRTLATAAPEYMHAVLRGLKENSPDGYRVSYEATHHGPTDLKTPSFFVEIGSTEEEWNDPDAAKAVVETLLPVISGEGGRPVRVVGFGGNHYAARETEIALNTRGAFGHIVHTRDIPLMDKPMIDQVIRKTCADAAYIDKKALKNQEVRQIEKLLEGKNIPILSEGEFGSSEGIEWKSYLEIRSLAEETCSGCRTEVKNLEGKGTPETVMIDDELIGEAIKAAKNEFFRGIARMPLVCLFSAEGIFQPIFITYKENRLQIINDLITLCVKILHRERGTTLEGDLLTLRKSRIDPVKAAELGVPKGPLLGELASGREVEIDGRVISPSMVLKVEIKTIRIPGLEG